ncbi:ABC transporter permease [Shimia thalassica]|uniref:ABC transporter permease n=1 Tax=Shimia thalassica TaxID=1715693 RepID=UPI0024946968|nr:ABC transporter permease [Shimia thalassica]MDO6484939.1 ABC transporter permease [Shimia thalassica]MDO6523471.1 ABC transporter permease [Shimia thalassica]
MTTLVSKRSFSTTRSVIALIFREMSTTYGRSPGGYIWAILEPVLAISLMTVVFSYALRSPALGVSFPLFYATGYFPFIMYNDMTMKVGQAIKFNKNLLAYPNVTYVDAIAGRAVLSSLTNALVFGIFILGLIVIGGLHLNVDFVRLANAFGMSIALGIGIGVINCYVMSRFPIWTSIWSIINRPMFIISGIFFLIDEVGEPYRTILLYNPMAHVIMQMRSAFYPTYDANYASPVYVYSIAFVLLFFGFLLLNRYHRYILDEGA